MCNVADILWMQYVVHIMLFNFCIVLLFLLLSLFPCISCSYAHALQLMSHIRYKLEAIKLTVSFYPYFHRLCIVSSFIDSTGLTVSFVLLETSPSRLCHPRIALR
jgi:hypothetical protein